ncbi:MAG: hypothetical protein BWX92_03528 [Deltaproteobacteria bacterium ADurb.Bin135]|jgi:hypothetical protein|nr:MAG: hypothetical protein BWX92_03528 [Deltaproteobacteria bacterium ADurb.Bin135]
MKKLNQVIEQYGRWSDLRIYTQRIDTYIQDDFSTAFENAKSLLETICKEICKLKNISIEENATTNKILKQAFNSLGYANQELVNHISTALASIGQEMGNLRNEIGITAHGKELEELKERNSRVDEMTREFLIDSTEIIATFLIRAFENKNPRRHIETYKDKISFDDNAEFNDLLDESYGDFDMGGYSYSASEILFYVDYNAYLTELKTFKEDKE